MQSQTLDITATIEWIENCPNFLCTYRNEELAENLGTDSSFDTSSCRSGIATPDQFLTRDLFFVL